MAVIDLRTDQGSYAEDILDYLSVPELRTVGLFAAMGFGKTVTSMFVALRFQRRGHIFVLTPRADISEGWRRLEGATLRYTSEEGVVTEVVVPEVRVVDRAVDAELKAAILASPTSDERRVIIANYGSFVASAQKYREQLSCIFILLDESHHSPRSTAEEGRSWKNTRALVEDHGGSILLLSATPHIEDYSLPHVESGLFESMLHCRSPQDIRVDTIWEDEDDARIQAVVAHWIEDGRPATIVKLPTAKACDASRVAEAFRQQGEDVEVIDTTYYQGKIRLLRALQEHERLENEGRVDFQGLPRVFVAAGRMNEGTDAPWVSHVYFLGHPGKIRLFDQTAGRAFRCKYSGSCPLYHNYPSKWLNTAKIVVATSLEPDDEDWVRFCQRLLSYRYASLVVRGVVERSGSSSDEGGVDRKPRWRPSGRLLRLLEEAWEEAKIFAAQIPPRRKKLEHIQVFALKFLQKRYEQLTQKIALGLPEQKDLEALSGAGGEFAEQLLLRGLYYLRPQDSDFNTEVLDELNLPPDILADFIRHARISDTERTLTERTVPKALPPSVNDDEVYECLRQEGFPAWKQFRQSHPEMGDHLKIRHLLQSNYDLGFFAVQQARAEKATPWAGLMQDLGEAMSHNPGRVARLFPEVAYFAHVRVLSPVVANAQGPLRDLTLREAHKAVRDLGLSGVQDLLNQNLEEDQLLLALRGSNAN